MNTNIVIRALEIIITIPIDKIETEETLESKIGRKTMTTTNEDNFSATKTTLIDQIALTNMTTGFKTVSQEEAIRDQDLGEVVKADRTQIIGAAIIKITTTIEEVSTIKISQSRNGNMAGLVLRKNKVVDSRKKNEISTNAYCLN
jgi:hypothetical protein